MEILGFFSYLLKKNMALFEEYKNLTMIEEHYAHMNFNRSSYEIVLPDSEESKRIAEYNKARRPELYK